MKCSWLAILLAVASVELAAAPTRAQCGGICVYENGSPDLGRGAAGAGARAQDASTAFWNPAGMTELEGHEVLIGLAGSFGALDPDLDSGTTTRDPAPVSGGNASGFSPLFGGYYAAELPFGIHFGLASTALYGGSVDYENDWTGRNYVVDASLVALLIQPSFAYAVTDWLSLGGGPAILYTSYEQSVRVVLLRQEPTAEIKDADDWSVGGTVSALLKPFDGTRIGVYYRTEIEADTSGHVESPPGVDLDIDTDFTFPQGVNVSLFQQITDDWAVLADVGWTDWSEFSNIPIQIGGVAGTQDRGWRDTWRVGAGVQFTPSSVWTLQTGFGYDSSPVRSKRLLPDIPASEQYRFSAGVQVRPTDYVEISASYQFLWFRDLEFERVSLPPATGVVLNGSYERSWANQVGVSLRVRF
ncbi:MAG: OmpP1/FadL family transporter [Myxococcota bacterium]